MKVKTGIGLDSHQFVEGESDRVLVLGGLVFGDAPALSGNSDADVILHAVTDAVSGVTGRAVIGAVADAMCKEGITDSKEYLKLSLADLADWQISHLSVAIECLRPKIDPKVPRACIASGPTGNQGFGCLLPRPRAKASMIVDEGSVSTLQRY